MRVESGVCGRLATSQGWCRILHLSHGGGAYSAPKESRSNCLSMSANSMTLSFNEEGGRKAPHFNEGGGGTAAPQVGKPKGGGENSTPKESRVPHGHDLRDEGIAGTELRKHWPSLSPDASFSSSGPCCMASAPGGEIGTSRVFRFASHASLVMEKIGTLAAQMHPARMTLGEALSPAVDDCLRFWIGACWCHGRSSQTLNFVLRKLFLLLLACDLSGFLRGPTNGQDARSRSPIVHEHPLDVQPPSWTSGGSPERWRILLMLFSVDIEQNPGRVQRLIPTSRTRAHHPRRHCFDHQPL